MYTVASMIINHKQQLSPIYWGYSASVYLATSKLASLYFKSVKSKSNKNKLWWHYYLLNYAYTYKKTDLGNNTPISVEWVNKYRFPFYNAFFHTSCMSHILYEITLGHKPVINDKFHVWDSFFKQPFENERIDDIPTSTEKLCLYRPWFIPYNKRVTNIWKKLFKDFCSFNDEANAYIVDECERVLDKDAKTLGVLCRGTDYITTQPKHHPKQPDVEEVIALCGKWIDKYHYEAIYLATEDERIFKQFDHAFPGMVLANKRTYYNQAMKEGSLKYITHVHFDRENDDYYKGLEYLSSLYILTQCQGLIAGNCGGLRIALFMKQDNYLNFKVFDKGLYS